MVPGEKAFIFQKKGIFQNALALSCISLKLAEKWNLQKKIFMTSWNIPKMSQILAKKWPIF